MWAVAVTPVALAWAWIICFVAGAIAYNNGVNVLAWSQCRAMKRLGYEWVTPQGRYQASGLRWVRAVRQSSDDSRWYASQSVLLEGTADDWADWVSDIGFDNPIAAHAYAEVQGWRAQ